MSEPAEPVSRNGRSPQPAIEVREMELEDLHRVFALGEQLYTASRWPNLYRTWEEYELVDYFLSDGDTCLVAEVDGELAGFAIGTIIEKRRSAWTYGYLAWLGVDPRFKRAGVATRLLRRMTELFVDLGARMLLVDTAADNHEALAFFHRQGFGHEQEHVYLTRNLVRDPVYERQKRKRPRRALPPHRPGKPPGGEEPGGAA